MPVAKERFKRVVAESKGTMARVATSPQLEWQSSMWRGRSAGVGRSWSVGLAPLPARVLF